MTFSVVNVIYYEVAGVCYSRIRMEQAMIAFYLLAMLH